MTNLQAGANRSLLLWRQRVLVGAPVLVGVLLGTALTVFLTVPRWTRLQAASATVEKLEALQRRIPILRSQLLVIRNNQDQAVRRQRRVLQLIEGSGDFSTFLAQLDREAGRNGLKLELFEPVAAGVVAPPQPAPGQKPSSNKKVEPVEAPPPQDPLQAAGLAAEKVLLSARGSYPSLLGFLRSVEQLSLLVVPSDFSLELVKLAQPQGTASSRSAAEPVQAGIPEMKLVFTYYRKPPSGLAPGQVAAAPPKPPES
jgi:type IV pilus assembly protein PilO